MEELKNLEAIRELLASHPIYTYDYTDSLHINKKATNIQVYSIDLGNEPLAAYISGYIITYNSRTSGLHNYWTQKTSPGIHPGRGTR